MGLFEDVRATVDANPAALKGLRVRDLVATGQVTQHTLDAAPRSFSLEDEPQGGGRVWQNSVDVEADEPFEDVESGAWLRDNYGVPYWSPTGNPGYWEYGQEPTFVEEQPAVTACDIAEQEAAENDAAERAFLRQYNMGTWLTSQPCRFNPARVVGGVAR